MTDPNFRKERIEKLFEELKYEITRGLVENEIEEEFGFNFIVPMSRTCRGGAVMCRFQASPVEHATFVGGESVPHTPEMVAAALLHDTVEDTDTSLYDIQNAFGPDVQELVYWLTDVSTPEDGTREQRKALDREHIAKAPAAAQTIKLSDLIDNTKSIAKYDPDFWRVYRSEKLRLLDVLVLGDRALWERAMEQCK